MPSQSRHGQRELKRRYEQAARRAAEYVRREYPGLVGIMVHGSVARGEPGPFSDIDMVGIVGRGKKPSEFSFFDGEIYVGVGFLTVDHLEKEFDDPTEFFWVRGTAKDTTVLYDPKRILRRILAKWKGRKPSAELLEKSLWDAYHNIIEYSGKLRNSWLKRDDYLTRYSAMIIAQHVERALIVLNDLSIISENYLCHQILGARRKPKHLAADYPIVRGLKATKQTLAIYRSAMRLCRESLRLIREEFEDKARHPRFQALLAESLDAHGL